LVPACLSRSILSGSPVPYMIPSRYFASLMPRLPHPAPPTPLRFSFCSFSTGDLSRSAPRHPTSITIVSLDYGPKTFPPLPAVSCTYHSAVPRPPTSRPTEKAPPPPPLPPTAGFRVFKALIWSRRVGQFTRHTWLKRVCGPPMVRPLVANGSAIAALRS